MIGENFLENSPVASTQSNGHIERAVQSASWLIRVILDAVDARVGQGMKGSGTGVLAWLVEYASVLLKRYSVTQDGKTTYERLRGKKSRMLGLEFGERVHWRRAVTTGHRTDKFDSI